MFSNVITEEDTEISRLKPLGVYCGPGNESVIFNTLYADLYHEDGCMFAIDIFDRHYKDTGNSYHCPWKKNICLLCIFTERILWLDVI